ncbi:SPW repeat protein [Methylobacterium persicinum]|uniref:SPW repeat-containing integral membrane domain-containing protein n=1 Tax=Methylobacterium persicinum TaxID=374426 RepID=A0ABU0HGY7_9HYPH|nr:SPW repeat protein [Methylobacterium persicinum]MDQ0441590.1 hypothetical protein [Methylobacterium persicinum]GJE39352.1 hypothetical protein KHHGKMAE_3433 [Methylobacterium persicinum]
MLTIKNRTEDMVPNAINILLGALLILSPWLLGLEYETAVARNALISGIAIAGVAAIALDRTYDWEEFLNLAVGMWVAMAPWVFGFADGGFMMWTHLIIGLAVAVVAAFELWRLFVSPETQSV